MVESNGIIPTCGDYEILGTLGEGGTAVIKLVKDANDNKYAMKIFTPNESDRDRVVNKTKTEFELVKKLTIPQVMKYYEFNEDATWRKKNGDTRQVCYLLMELLNGVELLDFLNECGE